MRVMVVSADPVERLRATSALRLVGDVDVVELTSAEEVRASLLDGGAHVDVLVIDGDLSPRGGFATVYDLRAHADLRGLAVPPALVLASREQDRWLARWAGASDVLQKPVDAFALAERVRTLVGSDLPPYGDRGADAEQLAAALRDRA